VDHAAIFEIWDRESDWIQTYTAKAVRPLSLRLQDISILDIAHALANQCRFSGHVSEFYSVAEHSVRASYICEPQVAKWMLLHDASEAYLVDMPRPLKRSTGFGEIYKLAEERAMKIIADRFGIEWPEPAQVKHFDLVMLVTEQRDLMGRAPKPWKDNGVEPLSSPIRPWQPRAAKERFLFRFFQLFGGEV
jgi:hypothetical protein